MRPRAARALGALAAALAALAAPPPLAADTITFTADTLSGFAGKKSEYTRLEGNAAVRTAKIEITAASIELSGEDYRFVKAAGGVRGRNIQDDMEFTCDNLEYDREREIVTLHDGAKIIDNPNAVTAQAEIIEYNQRTGVATLQVNIELRQKDSVCTGAFAIYRKDEQVLEMSGNPKISKGDDEFRARDIEMNLTTEEIRLDGRVRGTVKDSRKEEPAPAPAPASPAVPALPAAPAEAAEEGGAAAEGSAAPAAPAGRGSAPAEDAGRQPVFSAAGRAGGKGGSDD